MQDQETFDKLEQVWQSIGKLCESLTEREWKMPTDCGAASWRPTG